MEANNHGKRQAEVSMSKPSRARQCSVIAALHRVERRFGADIEALMPSFRDELAAAEERLSRAPEQSAAKERRAGAPEKPGVEEGLQQPSVITDLRDLIDIKRFYELILAEDCPPQLTVWPVPAKNQASS
jgi:hypothetical protein